MTGYLLLAILLLSIALYFSIRRLIDGKKRIKELSMANDLLKIEIARETEQRRLQGEIDRKKEADIGKISTGNTGADFASSLDILQNVSGKR
jgi:hypothetical protein